MYLLTEKSRPHHNHHVALHELGVELRVKTLILEGLYSFSLIKCNCVLRLYISGETPSPSDTNRVPVNPSIGMYSGNTIVISTCLCACFYVTCPEFNIFYYILIIKI